MRQHEPQRHPDHVPGRRHGTQPGRQHYRSGALHGAELGEAWLFAAQSPAALAVDAVERAQFAVDRQQIYAQRKAQTTRVNGAKDYVIVEDSHTPVLLFFWLRSYDFLASGPNFMPNYSGGILFVTLVAETNH